MQLTWMDANVGGWVATPRPGKPGEVNALWYGALRSMAGLARRLGESSDHDEALAGSTRFWNEPASYCFDVMDGPGGEEPSLRPNQSLAISVPTAPSTIRSNGAWWTSVPANRRFYAF